LKDWPVGILGAYLFLEDFIQGNIGQLSVRVLAA
jgi:hypothetical protein